MSKPMETTDKMEGIPIGMVSELQHYYYISFGGHVLKKSEIMVRIEGKKLVVSLLCKLVLANIHLMPRL